MKKEDYEANIKGCPAAAFDRKCKDRKRLEPRSEYLSDQQEEDEAELKRRNIVKNITVERNFGKKLLWR